MANKNVGKVAIVTGGGSGIGKEIVELFASKGYTVYSFYRSALAKEDRILNEGIIRERVCDVTDEESIERAIEGIDRVDVLIHVAGFGIGGSAELTSNEDAHKQMETNFFGTLNINRKVVGLMRERRSGLVIVTSSVGGIFPLPFQSHYSASKYALEGYAGALRLELEPFGVNVTIIAPGDVHTPFTSSRKIVEKEDSVYMEALKGTMQKASEDENKGYAPKNVAKLYYKVANKKKPKPRYVFGFIYKFLVFLKRFVTDNFICWVLKKMYL